MTDSAVDQAMPAAAPRFSAGYRRWLLILLVLIYTSNFVDRAILPALAQAIKRDLALSDTQLGLLTGLAFAAFYTALGIPIARLIERNSRVTIMTICVAIWSAMTALCGLAQNFAQLAAARMAVGVGEAGCLPSAQSLIADHFPAPRRATALAIFGMGIPIGSLIGAVAGGWIAQHMSWRLAFFIVGLPGLALAVITPLTLREPPRGHVDNVVATGGPPPSLLAVLKRFWARPTAIWVCAGASVAATPAYGILGFVAAYFVRRFDLDYTHAGLASGLISGIGAGISILAGGLLADHFARRDLRAYAWVSIVGLLVAMPLYIAGFTQGSWLPALVLLIAAAAAQQLFLAPTFAVANNIVGPRMRATSVALMAFVWNLIGQGFGPVIVGFFSDRFGRAIKLSQSADMLGLCRQAACADASATGLQYGLIAITGFYLLSAALFWISARRMRRDLAPDAPTELR